MGITEHDDEGRITTAEYKEFFLVCSYIPNASRGLVKYLICCFLSNSCSMDYRMKWDVDFLAFLKKLEEKKPVIWCGDLNVLFALFVEFKNNRWSGIGLILPTLNQTYQRI